MAQPPINIFSQHRKPDEVLKMLLELMPEAAVERNPDGIWTRVTGTWKRGWLKGSLQLDVRHDPSYYGGEGWGDQLAGMTRYLQDFSAAKGRSDVFGYLPGLAFAVSFVLTPGSLPKEDPRQEIIHKIARLVEGVIFLPGMLLDAEGHVLISARGDSDPEAKLPAHEPMAALSQPKESGNLAEEAKHAEPPAEDRVMARLVLLGALASRGIMESHPELEPQRQEMVADLQDSNAWREGEPLEIAELETPVGSLSQKSAWRLPWMAEGAAVLAWSLGLMELPAYDEEVNVDQLFALISDMEHSERKPELRGLDEIDTLSFQMLAIHWRLRQFEVEPKAMDFKAYARRAWCGPMDLSLARLSASNDLEIAGLPLAEAPEEAWKRASGIMHERRMALHWLLGHAAVYSENDTST